MNEMTFSTKSINLNNENFFTRNNRIICSSRNINLRNSSSYFQNKKKSRKILLRYIVLIVSILIITLVLYFSLYEASSVNFLSSNSEDMMPTCEKFHNFKSISPSSKEIIQLENDLDASRKYLSIYLLTWNVNRKEPEGSLSDLFAFNHRLYDVYAVVLEELPLIARVFADNWRNELEKVFARNNYVLLKKDTAVLTEVFVFVRKRDITRFFNVSSHAVKFVNGLSMKGGVGLRFIYDNIKVAFLGVHLTPHDENYNQRIKDLRFLLSEVNFGREIEMINKQDISFIFGDLNFRLNPLSNVSIEDEFDYIVRFVEQHQHDMENPQRYEPLYKYDQIRYAIHTGEAFRDYEESLLTFAPTFKFVIGSCEYDPRRRPAWTDRILSRNLLKLQLRTQNSLPELARRIDPIMMYYNSLPQYTLSDHKPVRQVAWIPTVEMKQLKRELAIQRRLRQRSLDNIKNIHFPSEKGRLSSDSGPLFSPIGVAAMSLSSPSSSDQNGTTRSYEDDRSYEQEFKESNIEEVWWPNVDDPELFQLRYRIEFYHIPNWNETRKFYAHFRIVEDKNESDGETKKPVSLNETSVKRFLSVWDWVGLFPENFTSLDNFLTYSYPKFGSALPTEEAYDALSMLMVSSSLQEDNAHQLSLQGDGEREKKSDQETEQNITSTIEAIRQEPELLGTTHETLTSSALNSTPTTSTTKSEENEDLTSITEDVLTVYFDENCPILAGRYVLLYVRHNGDVIGVSDPFQIERDIDLSSAI